MLTREGFLSFYRSRIVEKHIGNIQRNAWVEIFSFLFSNEILKGQTQTNSSEDAHTEDHSLSVENEVTISCCFSQSKQQGD